MLGNTIEICEQHSKVTDLLSVQRPLFPSSVECKTNNTLFILLHIHIIFRLLYQLENGNSSIFIFADKHMGKATKFHTNSTDPRILGSDKTLFFYPKEKNKIKSVLEVS